MIDALQMLTSLPVTAVSGTLDLAGRPDCRGADFQDPGGWGIMHLGAGIPVTLDAGDHSRVPAMITLNGTRGCVRLGGDDVTFVSWDGQQEQLCTQTGTATSMDRAVNEIVSNMDAGHAQHDTAEGARRTLEAILGFHASHARNGAWIQLPLQDSDRERVVRSG
jgi:hypothetical protein